MLYNIFLFNFNKCCIWIQLNKPYNFLLAHLTLTSVVFECEARKLLRTQKGDLTLTSVVFESNTFIIYVSFNNLTLTSVVFEYLKSRMNKG